jgi:hypothetical protein
MKIIAHLALITILNSNNLVCKSKSLPNDLDSCTTSFISLMKNQWKYDEKLNTHIIGRDLEKAISKHLFNNYRNQNSKCLISLDSNDIKIICGKHFIKTKYKTRENVYFTNFYYEFEGENHKPISDKYGFRVFVFVFIFNQYGKVVSASLDMKSK